MLKVKEEYSIKNNEGWPSDLQHRAETRQRAKQTEIYDCISEMVTLGILDIKTGASSFGGGGGKDYSLTNFGIRFLQYISE
ncbi:MAG: hypothetical protein PHV63_02245 [Candidatus Daviesbacteria bacterium]|nr:hypothetical protein [Candidatus Daviesbacteria bacterium]